MERCAPAINRPTLMDQYTGDNSVFRADIDRSFDWIGTDEKFRVQFA